MGLFRKISRVQQNRKTKKKIIDTFINLFFKKNILNINFNIRFKIVDN